MPDTPTIGNGLRSSIIYQWAITTLIGIICFLAGCLVQINAYKTQLVTNTTEIRVMKEGLVRIESTLNKLATRPGGTDGSN